MTYLALPESRRGYLWAALAIILLFGTYLRLPTALFSGDDPPLRMLSAGRGEPAFTGIGFDESLYRQYVRSLIQYGLNSYPDIAENYVETQTRLTRAILPPTRFLYIFSAYIWHEVTGAEALASLKDISSLFSILLLILATGLAWRLGGWRIALGVAALMACAPTQIHMSQHALIDGFFAFWATACLWLLWENLQHPDKIARLLLYTLSLALLVLTKENAMFVYLGILALLISNYWLKFGTVSRALLGATLLGPLAGLVILVFLSGGLSVVYHTYLLLVSKASVLPYAIATGDGPWYRYLVDLLLVSPLVFLLAWRTVFKLQLADKSSLYLVVFVVSSYLVMCNVRYGMNLRYANMWDMPLRYLAILAVFDLVHFFSRRKELVSVGLIAGLCAFDLRQYHLFFVDHDLYELVTGGLLRALSILQ